MNIALLIAAGIIAGVSVKQRLDQRRRRSAARGWLASSGLVPVAAGPIGSGIDSIVLDRLEQIAGFEPVYARRLNQSGILTYGEMADLSPAALQSIVAPNGPFNLLVDDWQAQARRLAKVAEIL